MTRIFVDLSVVGQKWFSDIVAELLNSNNIRFAYTDHPKLAEEQERAKKLKQIYKLAGIANKRDDAPIEDCEKHVLKLNADQKFDKEEACDDPHIFALNYLQPIDYVFAADKRIAKCRDCMSGHLDSKYGGFSLVSSKENYSQNRGKIHS